MTIRLYLPDDLAALHRINEENVPAVNSVSDTELGAVIAASACTLVIEQKAEVAGFVVCLFEGAEYGSGNYAWLSERFAAFAYVDRVAVDARHRSLGLGKRLYTALEAEIRDQRPMIGLEVNEQPPNPGSMRFHHAIGFEDIGKRTYDGGTKTVVFMRKHLNN